MTINIWFTWNELKNVLQRRKKIYIFGCSKNLGQNLLKKIIKYKNLEIVFLDNNKNLQNKKFLGKDTLAPSVLKLFNRKTDYLIIATEPNTILEEIKKYNLIEGKNFCCSPDIKNWGALVNLKKNSSNIIFSSSDYFDLSKFRSSEEGGGLFIANVGESKYEKVQNGQYRQFIKVKDYYYVTEFVKHEVHILDKNFKIIEKIKIFNNKYNEDKKICGITYSKINKKFFICNPLTDYIHIFNNEFKELGTIKFKKKSKNLSCHLNDITSVGDFLYVSYFSKTGKWRKGILDGGVAKINLKKNFIINEIISNLKKPHSPEIIDNKVFVLDSLNGSLLCNKKVQATFLGFVRGLAKDNSFFYIGQSEDMYLSKRFKISNSPIILNAGIYQYDHLNKITRFLALPKITNIHDIKIL